MEKGDSLKMKTIVLQTKAFIMVNKHNLYLYFLISELYISLAENQPVTYRIQ